MTSPDQGATDAASYTAFSGFRRIAAGPLATVALAVKGLDLHPAELVAIYSDRSGDVVDVDLSGTDTDVVARLPQPSALPVADAAGVRRRGRPTLGVVGREVTLLPRHWEWLNEQPGGASVALRKLVEQARRDNQSHDEIRRAQTRAYKFMSLIGGNLPNFEEAARALFANDRARFQALIAAWPTDVVRYVSQLAFDRLDASSDSPAE